MAWVLSTLGLVILLLAGDILVRGAVAFSLRLGVPALIVSLTIVAFGTSAPELLIAIQAIIDDASGIAIGNVVGSNTANILLVLGLPAVFATLKVSDCDSRRMYSFMMVATVLFIGLAYRGYFDYLSGTIFLLALALVLFDAFRGARLTSHHGDVFHYGRDKLDHPDSKVPTWRLVAYFVVGLIGLPIGAGLLVENATVIAKTYGVSDEVIGLTLVAIGTSLPELATTFMAALRRHADVAFGNVIGSNIFNLLAVIGVSSFVDRISIDPASLWLDLLVMLVAALILMPFVFMRWDISRFWGVLFFSVYLVYVSTVLS